MDSEDFIQLPDSGKSGIESESNELSFADCESDAAAFRPSNSEANKDQMNENIMQNGVGVDEKTKDSELIVSTAAVQVSVQLAEKIDIQEEVHSISSMVHIENGGQAVEDQSPLANLKKEESSISIQDKDSNSIIGVKRPREAVDEQPPSIHVLYNSLPRDSKQKLDKLLQQWSEWHARHYPSYIESAEDLESGETTYFPAVHVGVDKSSSVSYWMDSQTRGPQSKGVVMLDHDSVPLYDREYTMGLIPSDGSGNAERGLEIFNASRCFNCGSYNHSLKECPKPRDNVAVSNARKELKSKRNQSAGSRNPTRYYQSSPGGKYDGLRPGILDVETQKLLGLGELDPPPWLKRMREIGYPPGYLDPEEKDQPSGITIFAEEEIKDDTEDGEILDTDYPELPKKKSVEFPGINGPIPGNANEEHWTAVKQTHVISRERPNRRFNHSSESSSKYYQEQRWSRNLRDDGPPGVDPITNSSLSSYPPRYSANDSAYSSYSPRGNISRPRSPSFDRSLSDRSRRSPLIHESSKYGSHGTSAVSPTYRMSSQQKYSSASLDDEDDGSWNDYTPEASSHRKDKRDQQYHHSRR